MEIIKIFILGWILLGGAILFNVIAAWLNFPSWYDFVTDRKKSYNWLEYAWLFGMYPFLLGLLVLFLSYFI